MDELLGTSAITIIFIFQEYEDLDEIIARFIQPIAVQARDVINHRYYRETEGGIKQKLEEILLNEKRKNPSRIPYFFSASQTYPGKFMLGYMPRNKPRVEYISVCPEGFRYRGRVHGNINGLLRWFKEHFRDPVPGRCFSFQPPPPPECPNRLSDSCSFLRVTRAAVWSVVWQSVEKCPGGISVRCS